MNYLRGKNMEASIRGSISSDTVLEYEMAS